jgi:flagellar basal body-associated protein FliL
VDQQQQSRRRPSRRQVTWITWIGIGVVAGLFAAIVVFGGYLFEWKWTGYPKRTPWDWMDLLIVPVVLALGGYWFTSSQNQATQAAAERRAQDDALQAYLDRIEQLVTDKDLLNERDTNTLRPLARAHTLTVLGGLDGRRKRTVVRFLYEAGLIYNEHPDQPRVIDLSGADLTEADMAGMGLCTHVMHVRHVGDLVGETDLNAKAEMLGVFPWEITQPSATINLMDVDLSSANLRGADLAGAELLNADLSGADLSGANLTEAHLRYAHGISEQQLDEQCKILVGATMPNGQLYEDWLKDKAARGEKLTPRQRNYLDLLQDGDGNVEDGDNPAPA